MVDIRKAGVIGSGTMGSGIAALLAGIGIPVVLLDIPANGTKAGDTPAKRNAIVLDNLTKLSKSRIPAFFVANDVERITPGNTEDNLDLLSDCDWVVEVIVEQLEPKRTLMAKLEKVVKPTAIISSNTSGLPINAIATGRSDDFARRFLGTHFFNPPRHLKLLEIIPSDRTDPEIVKGMADFATRVLGKGVVICKDTPNFIGNRFISVVGGFATAYAIDNDYTVEEVDSLTGPLIGRPKSGTFRLSDVVGNDVLYHVSNNLYDAIPNDESREVLRHPGMARVLDFLMKNKFLGDKTGQGFFKKVDKEGQREFWPLDLKTLEYVPPQKVRFESVGKVRKIEDTGARIKALIQETDRAGQYVWNLHAFYLSYASRHAMEIADDLVSIDNANKWGFAHEMGPFEIWDAIGVRESVSRMEADGYTVAPWVHDMLKQGCETFYQRDRSGAAVGVYDPERKEYVPLAPAHNMIMLNQLRAAGKEIERNDSASLLDLGDGVCLLEFHSKVNALDEDIMKMAHKAMQRLDTDFDAMVIGNQGEQFSAGANLFMMVVAVQSGLLDQLEQMIKTGQDVMQMLRYHRKPIVTAPFGMALGGGAEISMTGARIVAHSELYIGLVEFGVGLIPAWTGTKEMMRRVINPVMQTPNGDALPPLQKIFEQVATAKVSTSAMNAREMGFLGSADRIIMNRDNLLADAKQSALELVEEGYVPMPRQRIWAAGRDAEAALKMAVFGLLDGKYASEHDAKIARKLAHVMCGGGVSAPGWVDEQYILDLEREAFLSLATEPKTLERIQYTLTTGKPLRN
ncbi:MAG TPA: 3-hydroxyacyl-CoA dehydrogenase/enoyl-CoA hydratase family protein [Aggregatilineales bacterium]|nr:3-hydroxyacyl-CoA dehydrogenase/enoyl-CoA hydratase family protein [Aggregatilineales bacterium]